MGKLAGLDSTCAVRSPIARTIVSLLVSPGPSRCGNPQEAVERIWASMNVAAAVGGAEMGFEYGTASVGLRTVLGGGGGGGGGGEGGGPAAGNWVVAAPTNAGKTAIFIEITK